MQTSGLQQAKVPRALGLSRRIFLAAAYATTRDAAGDAGEAVAELARTLPDRTTPLAVQSFVALSQTLPHTLAGAWQVLARQPGAWRALHACGALDARATEELLRLASPARAVFRRARHDVTIGGTIVRAGDDVVLLLQSANRDPARFPDPLVFNPAREAGGQVGLGRGMHPCAGASIVRMALAASTNALLLAIDDLELAASVSWLDGFAMRTPSALPVVLHHDASSRAT